jgi:hypothetical protein
MIFGRPRLVIEVMLGSRYALLSRVTGFLIATAITGYYGDPMRSSLLPFLAAYGTFPSALNDGLGWCSSATTSSCFNVS